MSSPPALDDVLLYKLESIAGLTNDDILTDLEISRGRLILAQAQEQLHRLSKHIATLEVALAPHKRLPNDIIIRIFEFFLRDEGEKRIPPALILGRVCKLWRAISHSRPEFWGTISVNLEESDVELRRVVDILPNAARLHVRVLPQFDSSALIPFLPRIDSLEWMTRHTRLDDHFWLTFPPLPVAPLSKQTSLNVTLLPMKRHLSLDLPRIPIFGSHPQLKECRFEFGIPFFLLLDDFPWNQIQEMTLRAILDDREVENTEAVRRFWTQVALLNPFHERSQLTALSLDLKAQILPIFLSTNIPWNQITSFRVVCYDEQDYMAPPMVNYVPIANFITRSACKVANFSCSPGQWFNVNPIGTFELLSSLEYCISFNAANICFSADVVDEISSGILLPRVRGLRMGVKTTAAFVKCVRDRTRRVHGKESSDESTSAVPIETHGWIHHGTVPDWNASVRGAERELAHLRLPTMITAELHLHSGEAYSVSLDCQPKLELEALKLSLMPIQKTPSSWHAGGLDMSRPVSGVEFKKASLDSYIILVNTAWGWSWSSIFTLGFSTDVSEHSIETDADCGGNGCTLGY
ncbi:hypothetical protein H0H93_003690 [Arthromyces matolae]|nr:hypothetical protein H0H93_003690 [Arthromyces matolae]